jgi:transglutaminase-like putative cysteine protease
MKISVEHSTVYRYDNAVHLEPQTFRLRPRMTNTQRLHAFEIQITPAPTGSTECLDQDGNLALNAWFDALTTEMSVISRFTVEMLRENPFDYVIIGESLSLPLWYRQPLSAALVSYRDSTQVADSVQQYAKRAAGEQRNALTFLSGLSGQIYRTFRQVVRPQGAPWQSAQTLSQMEGSCRDLAVLFCDVCRVMGIAARFVSGYECSSAGQSESYMHAWTEVYLPGIGWRGYDPSRGIAVTNEHVAVAAAFDYDLASPIAGLYTGASGSHMDAWIRMVVDAEADASP